jgi:L-fuculose-phosphate aldolase
MALDFRLRLNIVDCCKRMYDRGLVGGTQGNASIKIDNQRILITPSASNLGYLKPYDSVVISMSGKKLTGDGKPSSEYLLHLGVYKDRPDISAICHAHPIAATALSMTGTDVSWDDGLNKLILPEIFCTFGRIPVVEYGAPGTPELFTRLQPYLAGHDAFILSNHGAVTLGKCLNEAFNKMEMLERYVQSLILAKSIGGIREIPLPAVGNIPGCADTLSQSTPVK